MLRLNNLCNLCEKLMDGSLKNARKLSIRKDDGNRKKKVPLIECKRKELNFYHGQSYGKRNQIPLASKGWIHYKSKGDYFTILPRPDDLVQEPVKATFQDFNLRHEIVERLGSFGITTPTHVQAQGIPRIMAGANTVLAAETGCGKTLAYVLPLTECILNWKRWIYRRPNCPLGLIITPTRELAVQIGREVMKWSAPLGVKTEVFIGGKTKKIMENPPVTHVDVIVASFGVISKLISTKIYSLRYVRHVVLDEADALLEEQFEGQLTAFMRKLPISFRQVMDENGRPKFAQLTLASATMPSRISEVLSRFIDVDSLYYTTSKRMHRVLVPQKFWRIGPDQKAYRLLAYLKPKIAKGKSVIIYSNNKSTCDWLSMFLHSCEIEAVCVHGRMPLFLRQRTYATFKSGRVNVLCATNAGARGLDTVIADYVLNYEFPYASADYIHRCGRVGRLGHDGFVTSFISSRRDVVLTQKIEKAIRKGNPVPIVRISNRAEDEAEAEAENEADTWMSPVGREAIAEVEEPREITDLDETDKIPY